MSQLVEVEAVLEAIRRDIDRLERAIRKLEERGNANAAYDARSWKISLGQLYLELYTLIDALRRNSSFEATTIACNVKRRAYSLYKAATESSLMFIAGPSIPSLASLLGVTSRLCNKG